MDTFGFEKSVIINLQLEQMQKQFHNSCSRLNIVATFQKPTFQWLGSNIRGRFKTSDCSTGFLYSKDYNMQWGLRCDKGDIHFNVRYEEEVFSAIEPHFDIQEFDGDIIVGCYEMQKSVPLPIRKDISFLSEDLTIRVDGREKRSMPDSGGNLYFGDLSQQCNWPLNVAPPVLPISPPAVPLPTPTAGHVAHSLARAEPSPRTAVSEPMLHTLVSQSINRHNLRIFDPKIPPPPHMNA